MKSENIKKIECLISDKKSNWVKKAKWHRQNDWWLNIIQRIQLKYYRLKRKLVRLY